MRFKFLFVALFALAGVSTYIPLAKIAGGASGAIPISNGTIEVAQVPSGDVTISPGGVTTIGASKVTYAMLGSSGQPGIAIDFLSGMTPSSTGADTFEFVVPTAADGSSATWTFEKATFRIVNAGTSGNPAVKLQKGTAGAGAFGAGTDIITALAVTGNQSTTLEASTTSFSPTTCTSGDKLRANVTVLGTGTANWMLELVMKRTS